MMECEVQLNYDSIIMQQPSNPLMYFFLMKYRKLYSNQSQNQMLSFAFSDYLPVFELQFKVDIILSGEERLTWN